MCFNYIFSNFTFMILRYFYFQLHLDFDLFLCFQLHFELLPVHDHELFSIVNDSKLAVNEMIDGLGKLQLIIWFKATDPEGLHTTKEFTMQVTLILLIRGSSVRITTFCYVSVLQNSINVSKYIGL